MVQLRVGYDEHSLEATCEQYNVSLKLLGSAGEDDRVSLSFENDDTLAYFS